METRMCDGMVGAREKFKSYYVVWKPCKDNYSNFENTMFKSYYVVWKLFCPGNSEKVRIGLNRTMQYGNKMSENEE